MAIDRVFIIFNPKSTGDGRKNAQEFKDKLSIESHNKISCKIIPTDYAGHAKKLSLDLANKYQNCMIISSSGDGGYNEVINGILKSDHPQVVAGVLPSGNANDHYHYMHRGNTVKRILRSDYQDIDVLEFKYNRTIRYAHSYIGLGMTPQIGEILTANDLNLFSEAWLVLTNLFRVRSVKISVDGHTRRYDHLVFLNIARMSKFLKVTNSGTIHDGEFELLKVKTGSFAGLIRHIFVAASVGAKAHNHLESYSFTAKRDIKVQLDGEVIKLNNGTYATVTSLRKKLRTIV